jgi:hypothetical protein
MIITMQIIEYEIRRQIRQVKAEVMKLTMNGAIYPNAKAIELPPIRRTLSIKPASLHHVIEK